MNSEHYDITIVGAGLAGATLAGALARSGLKIALLDHQPPPKLQTGDYDLRVSSINRGSEAILRDINAWEFIDTSRAYRYDKVQVCQQHSSSTLTFDSAEIGEAYMGHMIENSNVVQALISRLQSESSIKVVSGITITALHISDEQMQLVTDQGDLNAALIVGADGPRSLIRKLAGFEEVRGFYGQQCIVGTVEFDGDHHQTAWQRFLGSGPLGILPLAPGYCSLAWSCSNPFAAERLAESEHEFIQALEFALAGHLGSIKAVPKRAAFPLSHMHPERYIAHRIALIGDAAHTIHPLAGLGANLGISDAGALAQVILEQADLRQIDVGHFDLLRRYERWRRPINQLFLSTMSGLNMAFSEKLSAFSSLRSIGLQLADKLTPAKQLLMTKAMGLDADQPKIGRFSVS